MKILFFILISWSFFSFAGGNSEYSCEPVSEVNSQDYNFDVIPIKREDQKEIGSTQSLDLSIYRGKIVLLSIFSPLVAGAWPISFITLVFKKKFGRRIGLLW